MWNRGVSALALLALLALPLAACGGDDADDRPAAATADTPARTETAAAPRLEKAFESKRYGYSVSYPAGWSALGAKRPLENDELPGLNNESLDRLSEDPRSTSLPLLMIGAQDTGGSSLDELQAQTIQRVRNEAGCEPRATDSLQVAGQDARLLDYPNCATYDTIRGMFVHDGSLYHVVLWSRPGRGTADRPLYDAVLASLTVR